ncbi:BURP domain-containing protein BNM2A [Ricinus communis]|uniref:Dehydration-responsive protein RD22, putative n=1 Tax=Ricinus communis TaxID=3988 RepID=B9RBD8_RICCO|nr:BURP domain-containing protein BNM2A [Ricinus communis]EEF50859.1 Dehydration-responsive protein RD22 precursor, putative [Ricinus communis]|eukprot:XP_002509472.1 BURP domain-containing protein BNM2A [Ricinus communis]
MDVHSAVETFLLHLLLVLCIRGSGGAREMTIPMQNSNVLRLPSMDHQVHAHAHANSKSSHMDHMDPSLIVFFTLNDLKVGKKMPIFFPMKDSSTSTLLPRDEADSIPFSSKQLPHLLQFFSFSEDSPQAKAMQNTLRECEVKPIKGETKHCATSAESMLDYVRETLGLNTQFEVLSTTHIIKSSTLLDNYTILEEPKEIPVPKMVACHTLPYPYTVFYCHSQQTENKVFVVSLAGEHGGRVDAVAVCHMDTSQWSRDHASFRVLGIEPGSSHVCHFFRGDNFVYVPTMPMIQQSI